MKNYLSILIVVAMLLLMLLFPVNREKTSGAVDNQSDAAEICSDMD